MSEQNKLKSILLPTLVLFVCCLVVTFSVSLTNELTKDRIEELNRQSLAETMAEVIPADSYEPVNEGGAEEEEQASIYKALDAQGNLIGMVFTTKTNGYGGEVSVMTGIIDGEIAAVQVVDCSSETPGLGQNAASPDFTGQFGGISEPPSLKKGKAGENEVAAITGATITSGAVVEAVKEALELYGNLSGL